MIRQIKQDLPFKNTNNLAFIERSMRDHWEFNEIVERSLRDWWEIDEIIERSLRDRWEFFERSFPPAIIEWLFWTRSKLCGDHGDHWEIIEKSGQSLGALWQIVERSGHFFIAQCSPPLCKGGFKSWQLQHMWLKHKHNTVNTVVYWKRVWSPVFEYERLHSDWWTKTCVAVCPWLAWT